LSDYFTSPSFLNKSVLSPKRRNYGLFSPSVDEDSSENGPLFHAWLPLLYLLLIEFREAWSFFNLHFLQALKKAPSAPWFVSLMDQK